MRLLFISGPAACGKLTVAREVAALTGWKLFHNHLAIDLCLSLFSFGEPGFIALRDRVWLAAIEEAARAGLEGLIFTFAPEATVPVDFVDRVVAAVEAEGGQVIFVALTCPPEVQEARVADPSRLAFGKLRDVAQLRALKASGKLDPSAPLPAPALSLDTALLSPAEAAARIVGVLRQA